MEEIHPGKRKYRIRHIIRYSVAIASFLLVILAAYWGYIYYNLSPNSLFQDSYTSFNLPAIEPAQGSVIENAFRGSNYNEVIRLNKITALYPKDIFLTGLSYLETGNLPQAISSFQVVLADADSTLPAVLKDGSEYYLALAFLKNRDYDQAIELMMQIHDDPNHAYNKKFSRKFIRRVKILKWQ